MISTPVRPFVRIAFLLAKLRLKAVLKKGFLFITDFLGSQSQFYPLHWAPLSGYDHTVWYNYFFFTGSFGLWFIFIFLTLSGTINKPDGLQAHAKQIWFHSTLMKRMNYHSIYLVWKYLQPHTFKHLLEYPYTKQVIPHVSENSNLWRSYTYSLILVLHKNLLFSVSFAPLHLLWKSPMHTNNQIDLVSGKLLNNITIAIITRENRFLYLTLLFSSICHSTFYVTLL